jgi:hypothetical protein
MNPTKFHISFFCLILLLSLTACPFDKVDEAPKEEAKLTHELLQYKYGDPNYTKVWFCTGLDVTYYRPDGSVEKTEELTNYKLWDFRFSAAGPYSNETSYRIGNATGVWDTFLPTWGRYELNSAKNQITLGNLLDPVFGEEKTHEDLTFDVTYKEDFYLSDWLKFTHIKIVPDGSKIQISFTLSI